MGGNCRKECDRSHEAWLEKRVTQTRVCVDETTKTGDYLTAGISEDVELVKQFRRRV